MNSARKTVQLLVVLFIFQCVPLSTLTADPTSARKIMKNAKDLHRLENERGDKILMLIDAKGGKEKRKLRWYSKDKGDKLYDSLFVFLSPARVKGTAVLTWNRSEDHSDQWLYMPARGKMQRIAKASKKTYFMGTDFTYEDLEPEEIDDFEYTLLKEESLEHGKQKIKHDCFVIDAVPRTAQRREESGYAKRRLWITKQNLMTLVVEYYDQRNELIKTQKAYEFENIAGSAWRAKKTILDNKERNHKTLTVVNSRDTDKVLQDNIFSERFLVSGKYES